MQEVCDNCINHGVYYDEMLDGSLMHDGCDCGEHHDICHAEFCGKEAGNCPYFEPDE